MKKEKSCGIIVFDEDRVLLIKHNGGHISFPKGHVEDGETPKENHMKDVYFFIGIKKGGRLMPQLEEVSLCDFFSYEDAMKELTFEIDRRFLKQAYEIYRKVRG